MDEEDKREAENAATKMVALCRQKISEAVQVERERCARIAETLHAYSGIMDGETCGLDIAAAIRDPRGDLTR